MSVSTAGASAGSSSKMSIRVGMFSWRASARLAAVLRSAAAAREFARAQIRRGADCKPFAGDRVAAALARLGAGAHQHAAMSLAELEPYMAAAEWDLFKNCMGVGLYGAVEGNAAAIF